MAEGGSGGEPRSEAESPSVGRRPPTREVRVREARPDELDEIGRQRIAAYAQYESELSSEWWAIYTADLGDAKTNARKGTVLAVEVDGRLVGSASLYWDVGEPETMFLTMMAIVPAARGEGAADALMDAVLAHSRSSGAKVLKWNTGHFMAPARKLYARLGYEPEQEQPFAGITLLTYRVTL